MTMNKILTKKLLTVLIAVLGVFVCAEENDGNFYKLKNSPPIKGLRGLAQRIAMPNTEFHYTPATVKKGVLTDLAMSAYAISHDNTVLALGEAIEQDDGKYINRIIFMDYVNFKVINGIEIPSDIPVRKMFFFYDKLYIVTEGNKTVIHAVLLGKNMKIYKNTLNIPDGVSSICQDRIFFYVKCLNKKLMQIDDALRVNSVVETRYNGGVIYIRDNSNVLNNLTKENIETFMKNDEGVYKSNYYDLQDAAEPVQVFFYPRTTRYFFFASKEGDLYKITNSSICEKMDVSPFQNIFLHPRKNEFYLLANKKQILEIIRVYDMKSRKELSHYAMRPQTYKFIKFMMPHNSGICIITQRGEFIIITERKKRFYKLHLR